MGRGGLNRDDTLRAWSRKGGRQPNGVDPPRQPECPPVEPGGIDRTPPRPRYRRRSRTSQPGCGSRVVRVRARRPVIAEAASSPPPISVFGRCPDRRPDGGRRGRRRAGRGRRGTGVKSPRAGRGGCLAAGPTRRGRQRRSPRRSVGESTCRSPISAARRAATGVGVGSGRERQPDPGTGPPRTAGHRRPRQVPGCCYSSQWLAVGGGPVFASPGDVSAIKRYAQAVRTNLRGPSPSPSPSGWVTATDDAQRLESGAAQPRGGRACLPRGSEPESRARGLFPRASGAFLAYFGAKVHSDERHRASVPKVDGVCSGDGDASAVGRSD